MASLIPGFEYDIFISYRQKDNKHDGWVTEFEDNLKGELESTFKEEVSVYFDINPHDGLLETHDVDASLKEKLKCLVFIPIISRTYCDPKSFAWEHEFKAFVELASQDKFGLKVRLPNGNVASRILPVRIHDLNSEDVKYFEGIIGGVMRTLDFVFKTASGVNRPLKSKEDHPGDNLNKTYYQDQINKVALAIREIITSMGHYEQKPEEVSKEVYKPVTVPRKSNKTKIIAGSLILLALIVAGYFIVSKLIKPVEQLKKSIAVLPFINDSPDEANIYFINGLMDEILNNLMKIKDLKVISRNSVEQYRGSAKPSTPEIGKKLDVNYIVEGSGQKYGNSYRLRVQLIEANNDKHLWAESYEKEIRETKDIYSTQSQIAQSIAAELKALITPEEKLLLDKTPTTSLTAHDFYLRGKEEQSKYSSSNPSTRVALDRADEMYKKALEYDPGFAQAYTGLANVYWDKYYWKTYYTENFLDSVLILCNIALSYNNQVAEAYTIREIIIGQKAF